MKDHPCSDDCPPDCYACKLRSISIGSIDPEAPSKIGFEREQLDMASAAGIEIERVGSGTEVSDKRDELANLKKARDAFLTEMESIE